MKVKFVSTYPPRRCGVGDHAKHLSDSLERVGINPEIITIENPDSTNPFYFLGLAKKASEGNSKEDIIHFQFHVSIFGKLFGVLPGFFITLILVYLKLFSNSKIVMALHDVPREEDLKKLGKKGKLFFYYNKFLFIFLRNFTDMLITHSEYGRKIGIEEWKIEEDKIISLPLGLPTNVKKIDKNLSKKKLGYSGKKILLILGFIRSSKNYRVVLEAMKELDEKVILLIAGVPQLEKDKIAEEEIKNLRREFGIKKRVELLGFFPNEKMPFLLNATDVGINLHPQGGGDFLSSTMAIQLAYQIPMLANSIQSFENLKKEEKCLDTYKEHNAKDLAKKIRGIIENPKKAESLKNYCREYWEKNNWNEIGKRTKKLYESLIK